MAELKNHGEFEYNICITFRELLKFTHQRVSAITFDVDCEGTTHTLHFAPPIHIFKAIVKAEEYLSEYIFHKDFWWLENECPRGNLLYGAVHLEAIKIDEKNMATLICGS